MELDPFNINSFISLQENSSRTKPNDKINQKIDFGNLLQKSKTVVQVFFDDKKLQDLYKNKSVTMLFLDKIEKVKGEHHPDISIANQYTLGPSTFASIEMMRYLLEVKKDPTLSEEAQSAIETWVATESECLPICLILDRWCALNRNLEKTVHSIHGKVDLTRAEKVEPPTQEVRDFTNALANHMKEMKPGESFKMPAGSLIHWTRLLIQKNIDDTLDIIHYNTGMGATIIQSGPPSVSKYCGISSNTLENPKFWEQLVEAKMQPKMEPLNELLKQLDDKPQDLEARMKKSMQGSDSCSFHSVGADFKHSFISHFESVEQGWNEYKKVMGLLPSIAKEHVSPSIDIDVKRMLDEKVMIRQRDRHWMEIIENPDPTKVQNIINAYTEAISSLRESDGQLSEILKESSLRCLYILDNLLDGCLEKATYEQLSDIRQKFGEQCTFNGVDYLGLKQMMRFESNRELIWGEIEESKGIKRKVINLISKLSSNILPSSADDALQEKLKPNLNKYALNKLLKEYLPRESPDVANVIIKELLDNNFEVDLEIIYACNKDLALDFVDKIQNDEERYSALRQLVKIISKDNINNALGIIEKSKDNQKKINLFFVAMDAARSSSKFISENTIEYAIKLMEKITDDEEKRDEFLSDLIRLVSENNVELAEKFIGEIKDDEKRERTIKIASLVISRYNVEQAFKMLDKIKDDSTREWATKDVIVEASKHNVDEDLELIEKKINDGRVKYYTFNSLYLCFGSFDERFRYSISENKIELALKLFEDMKFDKDQERDAVLRFLIESIPKGHVELAQDLINKMNDEEQKKIARERLGIM